LRPSDTGSSENKFRSSATAPEQQSAVPKYVLYFSIMYWRPWRWTVDGWYGAWVAALVSGLLAELGFFGDLPLVTVAGLTGLAAGTPVAGRLAGRVLAGRSFVLEGLGVGFRAALLALVGWFVSIAVATLLFQTSYPLSDRLLLVVYGLVGVPTYGAVFGAPFALLGGIAGALVLRTVRRSGNAGARGLLLATAAVLIVGVTAIARWI
jgi:hypothetical protein